MRSYSLLMFLALLGAMTGIINSLGIFPDFVLTGIPQLDANIMAVVVEDTLGKSWLSMGFTLAATGFNTLVTTLTSIFFTYGLLIAFGFPPILAAALQGLIIIVFAFDVIPWALNRNTGENN